MNHSILIFKVHCKICSIYLKHVYYDESITISHKSKIKTEIIDIYDEDSIDMCKCCLKKFKTLNYQYRHCKARKGYLCSLITYYPHFSLYNKFIFRHIEFQNKINKELIEHVYHPDRLKLRLDENSTDYLE